MEEYASVPGREEIPQAPYCAIPMRAEDLPLWAYRWRLGNLAGLPETYRKVQSFEFRVPYPGTYEVQLDERVGWAATADGLPVVVGGNLPPTSPDRNSGVLRLRLRPGGTNDNGRFTQGRLTAVTTGDYLGVDFYLPTSAVFLESEAVAPQAPGESLNVTFGSATVRIIAVPARSRRPSEWRVADWIQLTVGDPPPDPSNSVAFLPGASGFRIWPVSAQGIELWGAADPTVAGSTGDPAATLGPANGFVPATGWIPVDGAVGLRMVQPGIPPPQQFLITQRGFF